MADIIDIKDVKDSNVDIVELTDDDVMSEEDMKFFEDLVKSAPGMDGIELLGSLISLPDKEFNALRPLVLEEMEKAFNNSNDKYQLALALNMSGQSVEQLHETLNQLSTEIDEKFASYSEDRRDFLKQMISMIANSMETGKACHNRIIRIPIELCREGAHIPTYAHDGDSGCDVYALDDYTIPAWQTMTLKLGFKVAIPFGYELQMRPRSGMSAKTKLRIANAPGTLDSSYRGEVGVIIDNISDRPFYIVKGQRIAQMVLQEVPVASFYQVDKVDELETKRGEGGFGSSGK